METVIELHHQKLGRRVNRGEEISQNNCIAMLKHFTFISLTAKFVPAGTKTPSLLVLNVGIVR
jgi:hypothetical protein